MKKKGGGEYGRLFQEGYERAKKFGPSAALGMQSAPLQSKLSQTAHEHVALYLKSKKSAEKYKRVAEILNRAYERKGQGDWVPRSWLDVDKKTITKGPDAFIPRRMLFRNPAGYYSGRG